MLLWREVKCKWGNLLLWNAIWFCHLANFCSGLSRQRGKRSDQGKKDFITTIQLLCMFANNIAVYLWQCASANRDKCMHEIQSILCFAQKLTIICTCASIISRSSKYGQSGIAKKQCVCIIVDGGEQAQGSEQRRPGRASDSTVNPK